VIIDVPPSLGRSCLEAVAETSDAPLTHLIYSHSHYDHIGAAHLFGNVTVVAHVEVAENFVEVAAVACGASRDTNTSKTAPNTTERLMTQPPSKDAQSERPWRVGSIRLLAHLSNGDNSPSHVVR
jgi:glyoxylase-like metal-dependent hydrolase (beta-lactamase superfamily II)